MRENPIMKNKSGKTSETKSANLVCGQNQGTWCGGDEGLFNQKRRTIWVRL